jgi:hypothetical protein
LEPLKLRRSLAAAARGERVVLGAFVLTSILTGVLQS